MEMGCYCTSLGHFTGLQCARVKGLMISASSLPTKKGEPKLVSFDEALRRCQDTSYMLTSQPLNLNAEQKKSIGYLKDVFRNNFQHYCPQGWSIEAHSFPCLSIHALEVIDFLALNTHILAHIRGNDETRLRDALSNSMAFLKQCKLHRELQEAKTLAVQRSTTNRW